LNQSSTTIFVASVERAKKILPALKSAETEPHKEIKRMNKAGRDISGVLWNPLNKMQMLTERIPQESIPRGLDWTAC
jgi:hypothetical protein